MNHTPLISLFVCFQEFLEEARRAGVEVDKNKEEFVTRALTHEVRVTAIDVKNTSQIYEKLYGTSRTSIGPLQQAILKILTERENRKACKACSCLAKLQSLCKTHYNQIISVKNRRSFHKSGGSKVLISFLKNPESQVWLQEKSLSLLSLLLERNLERQKYILENSFDEIVSFYEKASLSLKVSLEDALAPLGVEPFATEKKRKKGRRYVEF